MFSGDVPIGGVQRHLGLIHSMVECKLGMGAHTCDPSTQEVEAPVSDVQSHWGYLESSRPS